VDESEFSWCRGLLEETEQKEEPTTMVVTPEENSEPQGAAFLSQEEIKTVTIPVEVVEEIEVETVKPAKKENPRYRVLADIWNDRRPQNLAKIGKITDTHDKFFKRFVEEFCVDVEDSPERVMTLLCDYLSSHYWYSNPLKNLSFTNVFGVAMTKVTKLYDSAMAWSNDEGPVPSALSGVMKNQANQRYYNTYMNISNALDRYFPEDGTAPVRSLLFG
jgi:hypothetical protein